MSGQIKCQIAEINIEMEGTLINMSVPAFTRSADDLRLRAESILSTYVTLSDDGPMSLADFGMYVLAVAAREDRTQ